MTEPSIAWMLPPISPAGQGALYQQIVDGLKKALGEGRIEPGSPLPSFRALAEQLMVSMITVKRAYEELEREGIIYRRQGLGTFVAEKGNDRLREEKRRLAAESLARAIREAREGGLDGRDLEEWVRENLKQQGVTP